MSNVSGGLVGRARNLGTNVWILIMAVSLVDLYRELRGFAQLYQSRSRKPGAAARSPTSR